MEKVIFIYCLFSCWIMQISSSGRGEWDASVRVQLGESATLNCSMRNRYEVAWYHLSSEQLNLLISVKKDTSGRKLLTNYNQNRSRLNITADTGITTVSLTISAVAESDLGLYFCGTKSNAPEMFFNKPIRLEPRDTEETKAVDSTVDSNTTEDMSLKERVLMIGGVGLAIVVFFLIALIAGALIHHRGWQKGWEAAKHS